MPLLDTQGNDSADAYGGGKAVVPNYIESVFSTYLYTGTGASLTITNNIDTSTYGGLTWIKSRSGATDHKLTDTVRGVTKALISDLTDAQTTDTTGLTAFGATGFTVGANTVYNNSAATYASWTFRKQPKFFDIVTYTGNGGTQTLSHNLQSTPGCIIVKATNDIESWIVWHNAFTSGQNLQLNTTGGGPYANGYFATLPTSTQFTLSNGGYVNGSGVTYVAYLFASNAGGFGLTGTDNVISCGTYTGSGSVDTVTLGYEPQWVLLKNTNSTGPWIILDNMRGMSYTNNAELVPNTSDAETDPGSYVRPTATGFTVQPGFYGTGAPVIYIAIRRGPMAVPTVGTSVFSPVLRNGTGANANIQSGFPTDLIVFLNTDRAWDATGNYWTDRLRSGLKYLTSTGTDAESNWNNVFQNNNGFDTQNGVLVTSDVSNGVINHSGTPYINWMFRRAPSFFDEVCYTGTGSATTQTHNLGVVPELVIYKSRSNAQNWTVYLNYDYEMYLNTTNALQGPGYSGNHGAPTSTTISVVGGSNTSGYTFVAYLFATCAGVSKVGSYTGNGSTQAIACGFTGGARFVLIKRTDSTGGWYVYDTARGMSTLTDPYLLMNSTAADSATLGSVTTTTGGFTVNASILSAINTNAASYIFFAVA